MFSPQRIVDWSNYERKLLRDWEVDRLDRFLECFWESQIKSKLAIIHAIKMLDLQTEGNAFIFGGWYGILACMLSDNFPQLVDIYSIDIDRDCHMIGQNTKGNDKRIHFWTMNMADFRYNEYYILPYSPRLVINTSTEHVDQDTFNRWRDQLPVNTPIILQGNNFFDNPEHVRCSHNMSEFKQQNPLGRYIYETEIDCGSFTRFMTIGYKI